MDSWEDITEICREAASQLTVTQPMLCHPSFSLEACMSATELMDPKMDQCFGLPFGNTTINIDNLLRPSFTESFTDGTLLLLIKSLIIHKVAFLDGASLLESTHQCVFLWEKSWDYLKEIGSTDVLKNCLRSYVQMMSQSLTHVTKAVIDSDIYEGECHRISYA